ncbi:MAG: FecR domain-containing protein [Mesorhizobium sp.]
MLPVRSIAFAALAAISVPTAATTAERVGQAVLIKTAVTGANGPLAVREPVHRDERIRTSASGLGQFVFRDGTKLAVGWGSSVVIDKYVFDDERSVAKLTIKATKGTFRWISGNSKSSAYEIVTPAGTIGVRGTAFDFFVGANGQTAVVLLNGSARFCNGAGCQELRRRCDCVVASPGSRPSPAQRVSRNTLRTLGTQRALPFLSGNQELARGFGVTGCGLASASTLGNGQGSVRERSAPAPEAPAPEAPAPEAPAPEAPAAPDRPQAQAPEPPSAPAPDPDPPGKPDIPDKPDKPDKPGKPGHHHGHHHGKPGKSHDRHDDDKDWGGKDWGGSKGNWGGSDRGSRRGRERS